MRANYWSCSKFADWIRKIGKVPVKLNSGTMEEWDEWHENSYNASPFFNWLADDGLTKLQNIVYWPADRLKDVRAYLSNRFDTGTHVVRMNLPRGKWHETDTRLLYSMFQLLVDFVECESAWNHAIWHDEHKDKLPGFWKRMGMTLIGKRWRNPELGIAHYEWARSLSVGKSGTGCSRQAIAAEEILHLYAWWTVTRPNRKDPYALFDRLPEEDVNNALGIFGSRVSRRERSRKRQKSDAYKRAMDEAQRLEEAYEKEDEEKMLRLVKIRGALWT